MGRRCGGWREENAEGRRAAHKHTNDTKDWGGEGGIGMAGCPRKTRQSPRREGEGRRKSKEKEKEAGEVGRENEYDYEERERFLRRWAARRRAAAPRRTA